MLFHVIFSSIFVVFGFKIRGSTWLNFLSLDEQFRIYLHTTTSLQTSSLLYSCFSYTKSVISILVSGGIHVFTFQYIERVQWHVQNLTEPFLHVFEYSGILLWQVFCPCNIYICELSRTLIIMYVLHEKT